MAKRAPPPMKSTRKPAASTIAAPRSRMDNHLARVVHALLMVAGTAIPSSRGYVTPRPWAGRRRSGGAPISVATDLQAGAKPWRKRQASPRSTRSIRTTF